MYSPSTWCGSSLKAWRPSARPSTCATRAMCAFAGSSAPLNCHRLNRRRPGSGGGGAVSAALPGKSNGCRCCCWRRSVMTCGRRWRRPGRRSAACARRPAANVGRSARAAGHRRGVAESAAPAGCQPAGRGPAAGRRKGQCFRARPICRRSSGARSPAWVRGPLGPGGLPPGLAGVMADPPVGNGSSRTLTADALRYSPTGSPPLLTASVSGARVELRVADRGPGPDVRAVRPARRHRPHHVDLIEQYAGRVAPGATLR